MNRMDPILRIPIDQTDSGEYDTHYDEVNLQIDFPYTQSEQKIGRLIFEFVQENAISNENSARVVLPSESNVLYQIKSDQGSKFQKYVIWFWKGSKYEVECARLKVAPTDLLTTS